MDSDGESEEMARLGAGAGGECRPAPQEKDTTEVEGRPTGLEAIAAPHSAGSRGR